MSFDAMAKDIAGTLSGVFGDVVVFERPNEHRSEIPAVLRRDVETVDESGQVMIVQWMIRFAHTDLPFMPQRGDRVTRDGAIYELGRRLTDNQSAIEFEAQVLV